jgi:hypothetical protein
LPKALKFARMTQEFPRRFLNDVEKQPYNIKRKNKKGCIIDEPRSLIYSVLTGAIVP